MAEFHYTTVALLLMTWAAQCGTIPKYGKTKVLDVASPEELISKTRDCDLSNTSITIEPSLVGPFTLIGVPSVLAIEDNSSHLRENFQVTSLDLNNVKIMQSLQLSSSLNLRYVEAPDLETVYDRI
ncbi:hypothetical protein HYALB_00000822 [Hymenoscyphus albidus]|uniref:Uncharacterized protein n=1 Tax=Hymenoscyphus albidus TaxID=595503 RepID=A0A9N9PWN8_9HELO|nr:hypothetical protein HYALB_00000822 [Hymenoscyphus albidus]